MRKVGGEEMELVNRDNKGVERRESLEGMCQSREVL